MKPHQTRYLRVATVALAIGLLGLFAACSKDKDSKSKTTSASKSAGTSQLIAVKFHADYCKSCKAIAPTIEAVKKNFSAKNVQFVTLDFTTDDSKAAAAKLAKAHGLTAIMDKHGPKTGFVLLVNAKSHEVLERLTKKQNAAEWTTSIKKHVSKG